MSAKDPAKHAVPDFPAAFEWEGASARARRHKPLKPLSWLALSLVLLTGRAGVGDENRFDVYDFRVDGNHLLDRTTVEKAIYRFLGPNKTVEDMESARLSLENAFKERGYATVVVELPEQDVSGHRVRLQVIEGTIEEVKVTGSRYFSLGRIRAGVPSLAEGTAPHMPTVQSELTRMAGESQDRSITPIIRAGSTPGKLEMELQVQDRLPLHGGVEINSRNSEHTSLTRLTGTLRYDNLWQRFHSASLQYQVSPERADEVEVWSGTYVAPTGFADTRLTFYGIDVNSNTRLGAAIGDLSVVGTGSIFGARMIKPIGAGADAYHSFLAGWDYKDFDQAILLQGEDTGHTPIAYQAFVAGYEGRWRDEESNTSLSLASHFALRGLGNDQKQFSYPDPVNPGIIHGKRVGSRANFIYVTADLRHQRALPGDWRVNARLNGQLSDSPLISNEQMSLGGPASLRGYHQAQQLGDHGIASSLELQTPHMGWPASMQNLRALAFVDGGYLWVIKAIAPSPGHYVLASAGLGLRSRFWHYWTGELDWSYPLIRQGSVDVGQQRVDFRLAYEF